MGVFAELPLVTVCGCFFPFSQLFTSKFYDARKVFSTEKPFTDSWMVARSILQIDTFKVSVFVLRERR